MLTFEFETVDGARDFFEEFIGTAVRTHRVVEVQSGDPDEARALARACGGREQASAYSWHAGVRPLHCQCAPCLAEDVRGLDQARADYAAASGLDIEFLRARERATSGRG
jgi:hypothetical protein